MDVANYWLASYLADQGHPIHLVTHRAAEDLAGHPNVVVHHAPKPAGSYLLGEPFLDWIGHYWALRVAAQGGRVVVNGGNCEWADINWVHYVHAAFSPQQAGSWPRRMKSRVAHQRFLRKEARALRRARVVISNSERTRQDILEHVGIPADRLHTVYYGIDATQFKPLTQRERSAARAELGWAEERPVVAFIGALGDRRKGFDTAFEAWRLLCKDPHWDADLVVVGTGAELPRWKSLAAHAGLESRIQFLGFRTDVPAVLGATDALIAPTRYEAYGLGVQEALCCGLPAFVTRTAGVAERYPAELQELLIMDPNDPHELARRLEAWRSCAVHYRDAVAVLSRELRTYSWRHMAATIAALGEDVS